MTEVKLYVNPTLKPIIIKNTIDGKVVLHPRKKMLLPEDIAKRKGLEDYSEWLKKQEKSKKDHNDKMKKEKEERLKKAEKKDK